VTDLPEPLQVAVRLAGTLDALGIVYTIGGSVASSFAGEPRSTLDVDFVVDLREPDVAALVSALENEFYVDDEAIRRTVIERRSANLIHQQTSIKVALFVAGGTVLDRQQLARRKRVDLGSGRVVFVHPPEDVLLHKLRWYRLSGETSERQWRDVVGIVRVQGDALDRTYVLANAAALNIGDLAERALAVL
jgi:hypothetical protein